MDSLFWTALVATAGLLFCSKPWGYWMAVGEYLWWWWMLFITE